MPQAGSLISETERREGRDVFFTEAARQGDVVTVAACESPEELIFHFGERWVEGTSIHKERVRIPLDQVRRFDLDYVIREGDDKTHYFFYLLLASSQDTLVYSQRAIERAYDPLHEVSPRARAETNLGALASLSGLEGRATFPLSSPDRAFQWAPPSPRGTTDGALQPLTTVLCLLFLAIALYYMLVR